MFPMPVKTFDKGFRSVLLFSLFLATTMNLSSKSSRGGSGQAGAGTRVTISVYNDAEVSADVVGRAEEQASRIFQRAGIEVTWLNCRIPAASEEASQACREAVFPEHLHLRIVRKPLGLKGETLGISFQANDGSGCYADLFYEPMEQLHENDGVDIASLLGYVAAHEIGHLLLGRNSHSATGIMHARWTANELASAKTRELVFSEQESRRMKAKLTAAIQPSRGASEEAYKEAQSTTAATRTGD